MDKNTVVEALARHRKYFNDADREAWLGNLVDVPFLEEPVGSGVRHGREHFAAVLDGIVDQGFKATIHEPRLLIVNGNEAAVHFTATVVTDTGEVESEVIEVFTVADDGRIAGIRAFLDDVPSAPPA